MKEEKVYKILCGFLNLNYWGWAFKFKWTAFCVVSILTTQNAMYIIMLTFSSCNTHVLHKGRLQFKCLTQWLWVKLENRVN